MNTENTQNDITATEDTEGHMPRIRWIEPAGVEGEDTKDTDTDTEGHAARGNGVEPAGTEDDTEGHGVRIRP